MIIGIGGKMCSGKTMVTNYLQDNINCDVINFADKLKSITNDLFGIEHKDRSLLQGVGLALRQLDEDVWVNYLFRGLEQEFIESPDEHYVIGDVRFVNELNKIHHNKGITIYIDRPFKDRILVYKTLYGAPPTDEQLQHESELISKDLFTYVINNDSDINKLYTDVMNIIEFESNRRGVLK